MITILMDFCPCDSVTRWLSCLFHIWLFTAITFYPIAKSAKKGSWLCQILIHTLKYCQRLLNFSKAAKFCHTVPASKLHVSAGSFLFKFSNWPISNKGSSVFVTYLTIDVFIKQICWIHFCFNWCQFHVTFLGPKDQTKIFFWKFALHFKSRWSWICLIGR